MLHTAGWVSAWMLVILATCHVSAQERLIERKTLRIQVPITPEKARADVRISGRDLTDAVITDLQDKAIHRIQEFSSTRITEAPRNAADMLADFGACGPFDYSARDRYLVAAVRDGDGLALWETRTRKRLRRLENSDREYLLVAISNEARWVAGVRKGDCDQVDLWRVDYGRHVRVIRAAGGPKRQLDFDGNELRVLAFSGDGLVFRVPSGAAIGGFRERQGGTIARPPSFRNDSPKAATRAAPSITRAAPSTGPPLSPHDVPLLALPAPQGAPSIEPRIPRSPTVHGDMSRQPEEAESPPLAAEESPDEVVFEPAAPAPGEPAAIAPYEPAGGAAPEPTLDLPAEPEAAAGEPTQSFHFEMGEELGPETESPAEATAQPQAEVPAIARVKIHFATNRNPLVPRDRGWAIYFLGFFASLPAFVIYGLVTISLLIFPWFGKRSWAAWAVVVGSAALCSMGLLEASVRSQLRDQMTGERYGCRPTDLSYGMCEISVPSPQNRRIGELSRPISVWVFEMPEDPEKHFMLRHVEEHEDKDAFYRSLSEQLAKSDTGAALLFIHGYNVAFEDAIFRTAQLAVDLKFPGAPITFCWPSFADPLKYAFDEQHAEVSIPALREVLDDLTTRSGAKRIHIIAHSMGNRVLAGALRNMDAAAQARNKEVFRELVLAAPDIDSRVFQSQVLPYIVQNTQHCTLYASSRDRALLMSRCFHNFQRLGEAQPELLIAKGLDTIDASLVDTSLLGHSYIGDVKSIVSDLHELVVGGKRPTERPGLEALERNAMTYWSIKPQLETAAETLLRR